MIWEHSRNNFNNDIALVKLRKLFTIYKHRQTIPRPEDLGETEGLARAG